jgi:hypothetical protein
MTRTQEEILNLGIGLFAGVAFIAIFVAPAAVSLHQKPNAKEAVLIVRYNEIPAAHAYQIFRDGNYTYAYDWRGSMILDTPDMAEDAMSVARWLTVINPPLDVPLTVRSAAYEWKSK